MTRALVLIDLQNDFLPGGALAVPEGDQVIAVANQLQPHFQHLFVTQDWHPADHGSFAANHSGKRPGDRIDLGGVPQILWPVHCVQDSPGASLAADLQLPESVSIIRKGTDPTIDSYSGFFDNARRQATGLQALLQAAGIRSVYLLGLATDYCVQFTALDAVSLGFDTYLIEDGCRGVNAQPTDVADAITAMRSEGVIITHSSQITAAS